MKRKLIYYNFSLINEECWQVLIYVIIEIQVSESKTCFELTIYIVDGVHEDSFITIYMLYVTLVEIQLFIPISFFLSIYYWTFKCNKIFNIIYIVKVYIAHGDV